MTKAIAKKDEAQLATYGGLMDDTPIDARDIIIPKLVLMQSISKAVVDEKARAGEIRGSIDLVKVAEREGTVEIIPFHVYKTWVTLSKGGSEFIRQVPLTMENYNWPREELLADKEVVNFETINYYVLLPEEVKKGVFMPYVVSFRSTSAMAGKTLETHRARLKEFGKPLPFKTFKLGSQAKKNDKGNFYVFTIAESRDTTDAELDAVKHWHSIVKSAAVRVDESDVEDRTQASNSARPAHAPGDEF